ncbi:MAG: septum formation initiator family protein [Verrucomicrobiota bacterium]
MKSAKVYQYLLPALAIALACVCAVFAVVFMQTWRENKAFAEREAAAKAELARLVEQNDLQQAHLTQLLNDPELVERVARDRLGYSREGEVIFKFPEK